MTISNKNNKKTNSNTIKFLIIGDLHGNIPKIHINLNEIDAIIAPGDFCGDDIRNPKSLLTKLITFLEEKSIPFSELTPKLINQYFDYISYSKGRKVLEFLNSLNKPIFIVPGNWDTRYLGMNKNEKFYSLFTDLRNIKNLEHRKINFKGITLIGHGSTSSPEPLEKQNIEDFETFEEYELHEEIRKFFNKTYKKLSKFIEKSNKPVIIISHNVPYKTKLDKIINSKSKANGQHYGSIIVKNLIKKYQPLLTIGGHIHEGHGKTKIGKTTSINSGFGPDVNTIIEIDIKKNKIRNIEFIGINKSNEY